MQISEKGNYGNFRYLQKHGESKKSIFKNFERHRIFGNFGNWKLRVLEISEITEFFELAETSEVSRPKFPKFP